MRNQTPCLLIILEIMMFAVMLSGLVGLLVLPKNAPHLVFVLCFMAIYHMHLRTRRAQHENKSYLHTPNDPIYDDVLYGDLGHDDKPNSHD